MSEQPNENKSGILQTRAPDSCSGNDSSNPRHWPRKRKWAITVVASIMTFSSTFASSIFSTAERPTVEEFGTSYEVMVLGLSLFMLVGLDGLACIDCVG